MRKKPDASLRELKKAIHAAVEKAVPSAVKKAAKAEITKAVEAAVKKAVRAELKKAVQSAVKSALQSDAKKSPKPPDAPKLEAPPAASLPAIKALDFVPRNLTYQVAAQLPVGLLPGDIPLNGPPLPGLPPGLQPINNGQAMERPGVQCFGTKTDENCVFSAIGNIISCWTANSGKAMAIQYGDLITAWAQVAGDASPDPSPTYDVAISDAVVHWAGPGIGKPPSETIRRYAQIVGQLQLCQAISTFGAVLVMLYLPPYLISMARQNQLPPLTLWDAPPPNASADDVARKIGHCVCAVGFNNEGLAIISWGVPYSLSWKFLTTYVDPYACFGVLGEDWVSLTTGRSPQGLDDTGLDNAFTALFAHSPVIV